jgi:Domain of unknown function (DUF4440)
MRLIRTLFMLVALAPSGALLAQKLTAVPGERREADRDAIRHHIESIFEAYMRSDREKIRSTHAAQWRGFLASSSGVMRGIDEYMEYAEGTLRGPNMPSYKILEFDPVFYGDVAVVPYIAQIGDESLHVKLRILDVYAKLAGDWIQVASDTGISPDSQQYHQEQLAQLPPPAKQRLLAAREAVWRDFFSNNRAHLEETIPLETVAINAGEQEWENREQILAGARQFAESGGKLTRLEFPKTEIQVYGNVAVLYSRYLYEIAVQGKSQTHSGRATEAFVNRDGKWVNVGWHLDSEQ